MADNVEVRGLELKIKATSGDVVNSLSQLQGALNGLKFNKAKSQVLNRIASDMGNFAQKINGIDNGTISKLTAFANAFNALSDLKKPTNIPKDTASKIADFTKVFEGLDADALSTKIKAFTQAVEPLSTLKMGISGKPGDKLKSFADSINSLDTSKLATTASATASALAPLADVLERVSVSLKGMPSGVAIGSLTKIERESTKATPRVNDLANALKKLKGVGKTIGAVASGIGKIGSFILPFRGLGSTIGSVKGKFDNLLRSIKRIAFYRAIRTFIKSITDGFKIGTENLYYYSQAVGTQFAPAMDLLATDLLYLRNSIGAASSPLIEKLAPAVDYATDRIVDMINVVNQLMAKLTGKSEWTKALKYPAEYAEETKNSAKAAKDYLLEFDELHVLDDNRGGRGADALDYSRMFEEQELDKSFATWVDDFKDAIANGDWYGAGEILGDKIDDAIKSIDGTQLAYDLTDKVNDVVDLSRGLLDRLDTEWYGRGLANFLNDCINNIETYDLGDLMGTKVQKVIDFAFGFAYGFDWEKAGLGINDFLEGYFEAINGEKLGDTASGLYNGVLTTLKTVFTNMKLSDDVSSDIAGFFNGIDWEDTIYNTLTTAGSLLHWISTTFVDTVDKIEWSDVATALGKGFKKAVSEIPWSEIWDNINTLFNAAADFTFDMTQEWGYDIGKNLSIAMNNGYYDWHTGEWVDLTDQLYSEGGTYQGQLFDAILSGDVTSIPGALFQDAAHLYEYYAGQGSLSSNDDENWLAILSDNIENMGDNFNSWTFHGGLGYSYNSMEGGLFTTQFIDDFLERTGLSDLSINQLQGIASGSLGLPSGVTLSPDDMALLQQILNKTDNSIKGGSRTVKNATRSWDGYKAALDDAKESAKGLTEETGTLDTAITTMSEGVVTPLNTFKTSFKGAKDAVLNTVTAVATPLSTLKNSVTGTFKDISKNAVGALNDTNRDLTTPLSTLKDKIINGFNAINTGLNSPVTLLRKRGTNAVNGTITDIETPLNKLKDKLVTGYKDANTALNAPVSDIRKQAPDAIKGSNNDLTSPLSTFKDTMVNGFMAIPNALKSQDFVGNATGLWKDVKNNIISIGNNILTAGELLANGMNAAFTNLSSKIGGYKLSLPKEFGGGTISFDFPKSSDIKIARIPAMAQGGLVSSPTTALIGEAGREAVMPLDNNTEWMDMLASRLVVSMAGTQTDVADRPVQVHVTLDGREIYQNQEKVRRSIGYNVGGGAFA